MAICGKSCFLSPSNEGFPICPYHKIPICKHDKDGIHAAYIRARQWKNDKVAAKALKLIV
jgi:hypothetical protein